MYASHKKDINRHKSFHPLSGRNLGKVEQRRERAEAQEATRAERSRALRRDEEQRRYDELALTAAAAAGGAGGVGAQLAKFRQVENIFAAEGRPIPRDGAKGQSGAAAADEGEWAKGGADMQSSTAGSRKRVREDQGEREEEEEVGKTALTGYVSTSAAAQMRREFDTLRKTRHDPLRHIKNFQNRTVAAEAKRREHEEKSRKNENVEKNGIHDRIQQLLAMKKSL